MKFQNLIYATMVACAFSACSNDDDPNIPDPAQELDATVTVAFNSIGSNGSSLKSQTKSSTNGEVGKIGIAVFNDGAMENMASGALINYKERDADSGVDTTACIDAKAGAVNVLVVVNPPAKVFEGKTNIDDFKKAISKAELSSAQPLMASAVKGYNLVKGRNIISLTDEGFAAYDKQFEENIKVFRNVANIDLESITLKPRADFATDAKLVVSKAFIMHYRNDVKVFGAATAWCPVVNDTESDDNIVPNLTGAEGIYTHSFSQNITGTNEVKVSAENGEFFVYDNSSSSRIANVKNATALVIQGTYTYTANNGQTVTSKDAYWTVYINNNETASEVKNDSGYTNLAHFGVLRNVKYAINATITGPGSDNPETPTEAASITSNIEIVPWGMVTLDPSID